MSKNGTKNWSLAILWINLILSIFIVFLHANFDEEVVKNVGGMYHTVKLYTSVIADTAVPAFFCISAYLLFRKGDEQFKSLVDYKKLVQSKVKSLLIPYVIWNIVGFIYKNMLSVLKHQAVEIPPRSIVWGLVMSEWNQPLWFIRALFILMLLSPIIYWCCKRRYIACVIWASLILAYNWVKYPYSSFISWLPAFFVGAYVGLNHKNWVEERNIRTATFIILWALFATWVIISRAPESSFFYYSYRQIGSILFLCGMLGIKWKNKPAPYLQNSFFTFCSHILFLGIVKAIFQRIFSKDQAFLAIGYIGCAACVWFLTIISAVLIRKVSPELFSILTGDRKGR